MHDITVPPSVYMVSSYGDNWCDLSFMEIPVPDKYGPAFIFGEVFMRHWCSSLAAFREAGDDCPQISNRLSSAASTLVLVIKASFENACKDLGNENLVQFSSLPSPVVGVMFSHGVVSSSE